MNIIKLFNLSNLLRYVISTTRKSIICCACFYFSCTLAVEKWEVLPETPELPNTAISGYFKNKNDNNIWYSVIGNNKDSVILLHGGLANSNYWGNQIPALQKYYKVIVMDTLGHGRSSDIGEGTITYKSMAENVIELMDFLKIDKASIIGWSDGANVGMEIAINYPHRINKLFFYGGNISPDQIITDENEMVNNYLNRTKQEFISFGKDVNSFNILLKKISKMWHNEPNFAKNQLNSINIPVLISYGDHEEFIKMNNIWNLLQEIPRAELLIQPGVSHFGFLQKPTQFNNYLIHFLEGY